MLQAVLCQVIEKCLCKCNFKIYTLVLQHKLEHHLNSYMIKINPVIKQYNCHIFLLAANLSCADIFKI